MTECCVSAAARVVFRCRACMVQGGKGQRADVGKGRVTAAASHAISGAVQCTHQSG